MPLLSGSCVFFGITALRFVHACWLTDLFQVTHKFTSLITPNFTKHNIQNVTKKCKTPSKLKQQQQNNNQTKQNQTIIYNETQTLVISILL